MLSITGQKAKEKSNKNRQIKSRQRVAEHGEVFTAEREVNAMVDLIEPDASEIMSTVFEPAVGEGVFLIEILHRKIATINAFKPQGYALEWQILKAVSSLYGVDIQGDNVEICRTKMNFAVQMFLSARNVIPSKGFQKALNEILKRNIVCGNTLTATASNGAPLTFSEWMFCEDGHISRMEYSYQELIDNGGECTAKHRRHTYGWMVRKQSDYGTGLSMITER